MDPIQWIIVLTGKDEGEGYPSVILVTCECFNVRKAQFNLFIHIRFNCAGGNLFDTRKGSLCGKKFLQTNEWQDTH